MEFGIKVLNIFGAGCYGIGQNLKDYLDALGKRNDDDNSFQ